MAERLSTGLRDALNSGYSFAKCFDNAILDIYTGTQPTDADSAETGTKLVSITTSSGAFTPEVRATGTITITGGTAAGSISTIHVGGVTTTGIEILGGAVTWATSHANTAALIAAQINTYNSIGIYAAVLSGAVVTLYAPWGSGAVTWDITTTVGGDCTVTDANFSGGTAPVHGLKFGVSASGVVSKAGTWSGTVGTSGTAGWFRLYNAAYTTGASTTAIRLDGSCATSGADLNFSGTAYLTAAATHTIDTFTVTCPAS